MSGVSRRYAIATGDRSKLSLDRRRQPAEEAARQAHMVVEDDPAVFGYFRHVLDIASRSGLHN